MDALEKIAELMTERNWTEYRLAKEANLPKSTVTNLFKRNNQPTVTTLESLCVAFGITLSQFFSESEETVALTQEQSRLLKHWGKLPDQQKKDLLQLIEHL
ncbi:MAG: helix-turn-helix transcriptional regulator [Eubacteriales bacterium]